MRFVLGGAVTVGTGLVARHWGPLIGGLFLSFPAIFPASASLLEQHQTEKKQRAGICCRRRGRKAAALDAAASREDRKQKLPSFGLERSKVRKLLAKYSHLLRPQKRKP